ncbi:MAG: ATP-binding protein [Patescibacteria group bacterium]
MLDPVDRGADRVQVQRMAARLSSWTGKTMADWIRRVDNTGQPYRDLDEALAEFEHYANTFADRLRAGDGLFAWSELNGNGKSMLAEITGRRIQDQGYIVVFLRQKRLFDTIRASFKRPGVEEELWETLQAADLVILDDLAVEPLSNWERKQVSALIGCRYPGRCLMVTTNCTPDPELAPGRDLCDEITCYDDADEPYSAAAYDRLRELTFMQIVHLASPSFRPHVAERRRQERLAERQDRP